MILILLSTLVLSVFMQCQAQYVPFPHQIVCGNKELFISNPCKLIFLINFQLSNFSHFQQILNHYQLKNFKCDKTIIVQSYQILQGYQFLVNIKVTHPQLKSVFTTKEEKFELIVDINGNAQIIAQTYVGFLRGLESYYQTIKIKRQNKHNFYSYHNLPVAIKDQPEFAYRGIMIDSARHFLPVNYILSTIDSLMYSKMSILHWHIVDEDSFPLILNSHPQIAKYAAFSEEQVYTIEQVKEIIQYALLRGVRVIPQFDTPGHAASWGKSPSLQNISCTFGSRSFMGPLDVTMSQTYTVFEEVFTEINELFIDPYIHLGGDEVSLSCLKNLTQVLKQSGLNKNELEMNYFRKKQRQIIKKINPQKICMYWSNRQSDQIFYDNRDVIHWWGGNLPNVLNNPIVFSYYGRLYLDLGTGNYLGNSYGSYLTWLHLYKINIKQESKHLDSSLIYGGQAPLWSESSNQYTHLQKIWARSFSVAQRLWNSNIISIKPNVLRRFNQHNRRINHRGIPSTPITSGYCEHYANYC